MYPRLADALARGGGNCVALSTLAVALAHDAGRGESAAFRVYTNHVAPEVNGFRFGMAKRCHGPGERVPARDLIAAYARARAAGGQEPFALPDGEDACDDPGDVFGGVQISGGTRLRCRGSGLRPRRRRSPAGPIAARPAAGGEPCSRSTRRTSRSSVPTAARWAGSGYRAPSRSISPATRPPRRASRPICPRSIRRAGELDVAREYERRLSTHRQRADAPLERVVARLGDPGADVSPTLAGAGRLVALGEGGRTAMLLASDRHRGFWELANLMTRPSSQVGAVARFRDKPVDVQLDVVDALPCASQTFLAQLDSARYPPRVLCGPRARSARAWIRTRARSRPRSRARAHGSALARISISARPRSCATWRRAAATRTGRPAPASGPRGSPRRSRRQSRRGSRLRVVLVENSCRATRRRTS